MFLQHFLTEGFISINIIILKIPSKVFIPLFLPIYICTMSGNYKITIILATGSNIDQQYNTAPSGILLLMYEKLYHSTKRD